MAQTSKQVSNDFDVSARICLCLAQSTTDFMYGVTQYRNRFRRRKLRNAMAQVEYMACNCAPESLQYLCRFALNLLSIREQYHRIQISLQCHALADLGTCLSQINRPIQSDGIGAYVGNLLKPQTAAFGKYDARYALSVMFPLQAAYDFLHVRK